MKNFLFCSVIAFNTIILTGCKNPISSSFSSEKESEYMYRDVSYLMISWEEIFNINSGDYYIYVYSPTCSHCNEIKQEIIEYALFHDDFYFVTFNDDIPLIRDPLTTIGSTRYQDVGIVGTPTLLRIKDHILIDNVSGTNDVTYLLFGK